MITHAIVKFTRPIPEDSFNDSFVAYLAYDESDIASVQKVDAEQAGRAESALQYAQTNNAAEADLTDLIEVLR